MTPSTDIPPQTPPQSRIATRSQPGLYHAIWRWHFYAGLMILPFLITLAVTGALYLFRDEIDGFLHAELKRVEARDTVLSPSALVAAAADALPGQAVNYIAPSDAQSSAEITMLTAEGERIAAYINPYSGEYLGRLPDRGSVMWVVRYLHSLRYFGPTARMMIEIAGGWSILLVLTGIYLWWPRGQKGGVITVRSNPARRVFWRDLHAVSGIFVGGFILFLALTGMPWSGVWGAKVNEWANGNNFGYPSGVRVEVPMSDQRLADAAPIAWSLEQARVPQSQTPPTDHTPIGLDRAVEIFTQLGLHPGFTVNLPTSARGVFTGSAYPDDLSRQRVIHLDQYSGTPLIDMSYADYGPLGRALEWGINVHMGQQFGPANQIVLLLACLAIVLLAVSAAVMWWKRRPSRALGVPPLPSDMRVFWGVVGILAVGGVIFPLVGLSFIAIVAFDWALRLTRRSRALT